MSPKRINRIRSKNVPKKFDADSSANALVASPENAGTAHNPLERQIANRALQRSIEIHRGGIAEPLVF
jgi:hypothetical protein